MDTTTYDTQTDSVSVQPPAPEPVVYSRSDIQGKLDDVDSANNFDGGQIESLQSQIAEIQARIDARGTERATWQGYLDGLDTATAQAMQAGQTQATPA